MLRKRLSLLIVVAMLLSMFVPTAYAYDIEGSDRAYDVQDVTYKAKEQENPFGAIQASDEVKKERSISLQSQATAQREILPEVDKTTGSAMYAHLYYMSETIGTRRAGTDQEIAVKDYIAEAFEEFGYDTTVQPFSYVRNNITTNSNNVIAVKEGSLTKQVIIGAHYDSVSTKGASDNASGVAVMLGAA